MLDIRENIPSQFITNSFVNEDYTTACNDRYDTYVGSMHDKGSKNQKLQKDFEENFTEWLKR
ncbi:MAG: hypothetical protein Q4F41_17030 [Eubacteriales bacterium]|nr:hypothetical protein [Eubacteriales bacterium]